MITDTVGEKENPVKYNLDAMRFNPYEEDIYDAFIWGNTPEGGDYWYKFWSGILSSKGMQEARTKWDTMKKQWFEEQSVDTEYVNPIYEERDVYSDPRYPAYNKPEKSLGELLKRVNTHGDFQPTDSVKHPSHYTQDGGIECVDAIKASLGKEGFAAFCKGNCMKYLWRYKDKNGIEDLSKAKVYLDWMVETLMETS